MNVKQILLTVTLIHVHGISSRMSIDVHEELTECDNGMELSGFDYSDMDIFRQEDGMLILNGSMTFLKTYNDPISLNMSTKRLERGEWVQGIATRFVPNFCAVMYNALELWYPFTKHMKPCPFKAGRVETFNMLEIGRMGQTVPSSFGGEWKLYSIASTTLNGVKEDDCTLVRASIVEV